MIVKDEARSIEATVASVKPFVDRWLILDTGSTDGTQALARRAFDGVGGRLVEEPFVDFGATRSRALDLAGTEAVFTLMLSGDERLVGGDALRSFCERHRDEVEHGAYYLRVRQGETQYDSARLARAGAGWRYVGVTHEVLSKPGVPPPTVRVPDATVVHDAAPHEDKTRRWQLDRALLREECRRRPDDARAQFYLAQTYECLGELEAALEAYERRVAMGGWHEEVYEALFRGARVMDALERPWALAQNRYLEAHARSPDRAEPLHAIAHHWYVEQNWPLTYLFARRGAELPYPEKATLFVDADVYRYKLADLLGIAAYYVGELEVGERAVRKALEARPGDRRLEENLGYYVQRRS